MEALIKKWGGISAPSLDEWRWVMNYFARTDEHLKNIECFKMFKRYFEWAWFYQPNPEKAPWHWQAVIRGEGPYETIINFWPHIAKAQRDGCKSVVGWDNIRSLMCEVIDENGFCEECEVLE